MTQFRIGRLAGRARAAFTVTAFAGGFLWDAVTLGDSIDSLDLVILLGYLLTAGALLIGMGRRSDRGGEGGFGALSAAGSASPGMPAASGTANPRLWIRDNGPAFALQFLFGSLFSALLIFYFLSSSYLPGFLLVAALTALLVLNEFLESAYHRFTITWTLYGICAILFLNFALPHLFGSVHPIWFFASTLAGLGVVSGIKVLSPKASGSLVPAFAAAAALVLLFLGNAIPPVPIVKKQMAMCRSLAKDGPVYRGEVEKQPFYGFWRNSEPVVRQRPGEKIFCFTSVFLPTGIRCTLYHRWMYDDPRKGEWVEHSRIGFPIHGGRKDGFRGFTYKRNLTPGKWEVRVETESGRVIGTIHFRAEASSDTGMVFKKKVFD